MVEGTAGRRDREAGAHKVGGNERGALADSRLAIVPGRRFAGCTPERALPPGGGVPAGGGVPPGGDLLPCGDLSPPAAFRRDGSPVDVPPPVLPLALAAKAVALLGPSGCGALARAVANWRASMDWLCSSLRLVPTSSYAANKSTTKPPVTRARPNSRSHVRPPPGSSRLLPALPTNPR